MPSGDTWFFPGPKTTTGDGPAVPPENPPPQTGAPAGSVLDRRLGLDRRLIREHNAPEGTATGAERRRGPGRRRSDFSRAAEEGEMTHEQFLFLMAINRFKEVNSKMFPTWSDVLEVVRLLGYRKTMPSEIRLGSAEDWREKPDTASGVKDITYGPRSGTARDAA